MSLRPERPSPPLLLLLGGLVLVGLLGTASAQEAHEAHEAAQPEIQYGPRSLHALGAQLHQLVEGIAPDSFSELEFVHPSPLPPSSPRGAALTRVLHDQFAAWGRADGAGKLTVRVEASPHALRFELRFSPPRRWWNFFFRPSDEEAHLDWPLGAELRSYIAERPQTTAATLTVRSATLPDHDDGPYLALAGLSHGALLALTEETAHVLTPQRRRRFALTQRHALPRGIRPGVVSQRPMATLVADGPNWLGTWNHRQTPWAFRFADDTLTAAAAEPSCTQGLPVHDGCIVPVHGRDYFSADLQSRPGFAPPLRAPSRFYNRQSIVIERRNGEAQRVELTITPGGRLLARSHLPDGPRDVGMPNHGIALAAADIDADGNLEVLVSAATSTGEGDQLTLYRLTAAGGLRTIWQGDALDGSVLLAAAADLDGDGLPELIAIEEGSERSTLWSIR